MSYTIKKTDGTTLATVPENEIILDKASVALVGRGSTNYGVSHSENFIHLLENFANTTAPAYPLQGQLWYDKTISSLKVYNGTIWTQIGSGGGGGGDAGADGAGTVYVQLGSTSALALIAGGKVIAVLSSADVSNIDLPETIDFLNSPLPFRARFPAGLQAGQTLATDNADYVYQGHVPIADQALYAGGGDPLAATTFVDLGNDSVSLTIANNVMIAAYSAVPILNTALPANVTVGSTVVPFASAFPNGLAAGLTFAASFGISLGGGFITGSNVGGASLTLGVVQQLVNDEADARASAIINLQAYADATYASASVTTAIEAAFITSTGQSTLSTALDYIVASATEGTGAAEAGTIIRTEITNAITGATSYADALSKINVSVTSDTATATALDTLTAEIQTGTGATSIANISDALAATATAAGSSATRVDTLEAQFKSVTGETTIASAISKLWAEASSGGNAIAGWSLEVNAQGQIAGIQLNANSATKSSSIIMQAENFRLYSASTPTITPFEIIDNIVYIKTLMIGNGTIGFEKIKPLTIIPQVYFGYKYTGYFDQAIYGGACNIATGTVPAGSKVVLWFNANVTGGDDDYMTIRIRRTAPGGAVFDLPGRGLFGAPDTGGAAQAWTFTDTVPADGNYTYTVWANDVGAANLEQAAFLAMIQKQTN